MSSVRLTQRNSIENISHVYQTDVPHVPSSHSMHTMNEVQPSGLDISKDISLSIKPKANMRTYLENMDFPEMVRLINWFLVFSSVIIFNIPLFMNADAQAHGHPTGDYAYFFLIMTFTCDIIRRDNCTNDSSWRFHSFSICSISSTRFMFVVRVYIIPRIGGSSLDNARRALGHLWI